MSYRQYSGHYSPHSYQDYHSDHYQSSYDERTDCDYYSSRSSRPASSHRHLTPHGLDGRFDLSRYLGTWYEAGRLPTPFQQNCARSIANYSNIVDRDGVIFITVENTCLDAMGNVVEVIRGSGEVISDDIPPELIVNFPNTPQSNDINYVVRETDYDSYAIVGTFDNRSLFILTRNEVIDQEQYAFLVERARQFGYPVDQIILDQGAVRGLNGSNMMGSNQRNTNSNQGNTNSNGRMRGWDCKDGTCRKRKCNSKDDSCNDGTGNNWWWIIIIIVIILVIVLIGGMMYKAYHGRNQPLMTGMTGTDAQTTQIHAQTTTVHTPTH